MSIETATFAVQRGDTLYSCVGNELADKLAGGDLLLVQRDGDEGAGALGYHATRTKARRGQCHFHSVYAAEGIDSGNDKIAYEADNKSFHITFDGQKSWEVKSPRNCENIGINLTPGKQYFSLSGECDSSHGRGGTSRFTLSMCGTRIAEWTSGYDMGSGLKCVNGYKIFQWPAGAELPPATAQYTSYDYSPNNKSELYDGTFAPLFFELADGVTAKSFYGSNMKTKMDNGEIKAGMIVIQQTQCQSDGQRWLNQFVFKVIDPAAYKVTGKDGKTEVILEFGNGTYDHSGISTDWGEENLIDAFIDCSNVGEIEGVTLIDHVFSGKEEVPALPDLVLDTDLIPCTLADGSTKTVTGAQFKELLDRAPDAPDGVTPVPPEKWKDDPNVKWKTYDVSSRNPEFRLDICGSGNSGPKRLAYFTGLGTGKNEVALQAANKNGNYLFFDSDDPNNLFPVCNPIKLAKPCDKYDGVFYFDDAVDGRGHGYETDTCYITFLGSKIESKHLKAFNKGGAFIVDEETLINFQYGAGGCGGYQEAALELASLRAPLLRQWKDDPTQYYTDKEPTIHEEAVVLRDAATSAGQFPITTVSEWFIDGASAGTGSLTLLPEHNHKMLTVKQTFTDNRGQQIESELSNAAEILYPRWEKSFDDKVQVYTGSDQNVNIQYYGGGPTDQANCFIIPTTKYGGSDYDLGIAFNQIPLGTIVQVDLNSMHQNLRLIGKGDAKPYAIDYNISREEAVYYLWEGVYGDPSAVDFHTNDYKNPTYIGVSKKCDFYEKVRCEDICSDQYDWCVSSSGGDCENKRSQCLSDKC